MPDFKIFKGNSNEVLGMFRHDNILLVFFILLAIVIGFICVCSIMFYNSLQESDTIINGIYIKGVNVSGLNKIESMALLEKEINDKLNDHIELTYKNHNYYVDIEQFDCKFNVEECVDYALTLGKSGDFFKDIKEFINVYTMNLNIDPVLNYDEDALDNYLMVIEANLPDQLIQSDYYIEDDELILVSGHIGAGIETKELKEDILNAIRDVSFANKYITIPTYEQYPDPIDVAKIHEEVYTEAQNAYFTTEPYAVFADVTGVDFSVQNFVDMVNNNPGKEEYSIKLDYTYPEITVNDLGKEAFPNLLASFSTNYVTSNQDRTTNLRLAARKIDGKVLMPGEVFSYNKVVGKRTIAAGYKNAAIYQDGGVTDGLGGGICQISTTLYNAAIKAGMRIEERRNHMFVPSYADAGKDATVVWGSQDFKFSNPRDYPIKIETDVSGGVANVKIYGLRTGEDYDIYNLSIGTKTKKKTSTSLVVESYRDYKDSNGNLVKRDKLYTDTYSLSSH